MDKASSNTKGWYDNCKTKRSKPPIIFCVLVRLQFDSSHVDCLNMQSSPRLSRKIQWFSGSFDGNNTRVPPGDNNCVLDIVTSLTESALNSFPLSLKKKGRGPIWGSYYLVVFTRFNKSDCDTSHRQTIFTPQLPF